MLNFDKFINESQENEFNSLEKGDIILHRGTRCEVKSVLTNKEGGVDTIKLDKSNKTLNLAQFKQQVSGVIKKQEKKKEDDEK